MELSKKIEAIIYAYDLHCLGMRVSPAPELLKFSVFPDSLARYAPSFQERCSITAWDFCYAAFTHVHPKGNIKIFQEKFFGTVSGLKAYQLALDTVSQKLPQKISAEEITKFQNEMVTQGAKRSA